MKFFWLTKHDTMIQ